MTEKDLQERVGLDFVQFLEIPIDDRYASLQRIQTLPRMAYEFRLRLGVIRRERDGKVWQLKHSILTTKNPNTGRPYSLELAEEMAKLAFQNLQKNFDEVEAYLDSLKDMVGLMKGEQGRWNRETDGENLQKD